MKNILNKLSTICKSLLATSILAASVGTYADDTEVFYSVNVSKPNLLFVLDVSGSMRAQVPGAATGTPGTFDKTINNGSDDSFQNRSSGSSLFTGTTAIDIRNNTYTRFRFENVSIPQGSEITNAYIQFQSTKIDTGQATMLSYFDYMDDAPQFKNIFTGNVYRGPNWIIPNNWGTGDRGPDQQAPVTSQVQDIVSRGGWAENNSMAFYFGANDDNNRTVASVEHPNFAAAQLHVEYVTDGQSRLQVMQSSLRAVLDGSPDNVKIGLMNYGLQDITNELDGNFASNYRHHSVGGITFPITDINEKAREIVPTTGTRYGLPFPNETTTIRQYIADIADTWSPTSYTPIVDALYEAALYFRGEKIHYGQNDPTLNGAHPSSYDGTPVNFDVNNTAGPGRDNATAPKYKTPIESSCQENYIVLMTDGAPTYRYSGVLGNGNRGPFASIKGTTNGPQGSLASAITSCADAEGVSVAGNCGAEITHYIANNDNLPSPTGSFPNGQAGDQYIETFSIGFGTGAGTNTEKYLKSLATYDDGDASTDDDGYFLASSPEELAKAFADILAEVAAPKGTLASPGYSVNVKNGLEHEKDIYIPVFDRKNTARWSGNLKKFKITDANGKRRIIGKNNQLATDELGNFTTDAIDYWSSSPNSIPDGRDVQKGGVANMLDPDNRNVFSNLTGTSNVSLNTSANKVDLSNINNLTNDTLGLPASSTLEYRKRIVNFMRGWKNGETDSNATPPPEKRYHMGDMLHSEPLVMTYNKGTGPSSAGKKQYIFAGTNEGYLHAFDAETGEEKFAFIPADLLKTLSESQFLNAGTQKDHKYGIDGAITGDFTGGDDGTLDPGDQIIIYFGMRRGGTAHYAMDVTDIDNPKLLWKNSAAEHPSMGQSWGTPWVARVADTSGNPREVVIVTGGYDEDEDRDKTDGSGEVDDSTVTVTADVGNDIFIFDAKDGSKLWSMSASMRSQIKSSIAGGIRPLDTNSNKLIDRIYFGDTGGNVWRLDLSENNGDVNRPDKLIKLASLGGSGVNNRMFFNEPDIALMRLNGKSVYAVSIGSGFRAHPMDQVIDDKFYVLIDNSPYAPLESPGGTPYVTITESNLASITVTSSGGVTQNGSILDVTKRGWMINLPENGEKVLGEATAVNGNIIFPTLVPEVLANGEGIDQCAAPVTYSRLYALDILTGTPKWDLNGDGSPVPFTDPLTTEIISSVDKVFNTPEPNAPVIGEDGQPTGETECKHIVDLRVGKKSSQVSGYNTCELEPVYWSDPEDSSN